MADTSVTEGTVESASKETSAPAGQNAAQSTPESSPQSFTFGGKTYGSVDEVGKAYENLQQEHGRWTQQYGDLKKQYDQTAEQAKKWNDWWEGVRPIWGDDVENLLRQKLSGQHGAQAQRQAQQQVAQMQQQTQPQADPYEGYEMLPPREQFERFRKSAYEEMGGYMQQQMSQLANAVQQTLQQKEQWYQTYLNNHLGLLRKALEEKQRNPEFNIDKVMEMAAQAIGGQIDPIQLGQQLISASTFQAELDKAKKASYEAGKTDAVQAAENKAKEQVPAFGGPPPAYKIPDQVNNGGRASLTKWRQGAADNIYKRFGPQWMR